MASKAITLKAGTMVPDNDLPTELSGIVQATAGSVVVYDGTDATGPAVLASSAIGTVSLNEPVTIHTGIFVVLAGGGTGSLLTA